MAAVIRYLSADNHPADTLSFSSPETGRHIAIMSLFHAVTVVFEMNDSTIFTILYMCSMITVYVPECGYHRLTESKSSKKYSCSPVFHIYIYSAFTSIL